MNTLKRRNCENERPEPVKRKLPPKRIPVDPECSKMEDHHVYCENNIIYSVTLNQTNLQNNNNKFFIIQLLEHDKKKSYSVYFRWGRVGKKGQNNILTFAGQLSEAKSAFEKKFYDKTKNLWLDAQNGQFEKKDSKYDYLHIQLDPQEDEQKSVVRIVSKLSETIKSLLALICDKRLMEDIMAEMSYDSQKTPLGKLTTQQIREGYKALEAVTSALLLKKGGSELVRACNQFYTKIPHNFGMKTPPVLRTMDDVSCKMEMLETLENIRLAFEVMSARETIKAHPLDRYYRSLQRDLDVLDHSSEEFKVLKKVVEDTHGPTHKYHLKITEAFKCHKEFESSRFQNCGRSLLLWHGSRLSNWIGILKEGLRIAPPEAPVTGYMFGKGIYFADVCTKSANYSITSKQEKESLLVLCEVGVGKSLPLLKSKDMPKKLPSEYKSVHGIGRYQPRSVERTALSAEAEVAFGPLVEDKSGKEYELIYNEYIVYDCSQVKLRYLVKVQFSHFQT